jgi:hypothetical protein
MSDELAGVQEAGDSSPEQAVTAEPTGPVRLGIDLDTTVEGRALKSTYMSQIGRLERDIADAARRAETAERKAEQIAAQANAMVEAVKGSDPEAADALIREAALAEAQAELKQLRAFAEQLEQREREEREAAEQFEAAQLAWNQTAASMGVDPNDPEFRAALEKTYAEGNTTFAFSALANIVAKRNSTNPSTPEPDFVSPPSGGSPRPTLKEADKEALYGELNELYKEPTKNKARIAALKAKLG